MLSHAKTLIRRIHKVTHRDGSVTLEERYAVCSLTLSASQAETTWRNHWSIENNSHHRRDTIFHEDRCRLRKGAQGKVMLVGTLLTLLHVQTKQLKAFVRKLCSNPIFILKLIRPELG